MVVRAHARNSACSFGAVLCSLALGSVLAAFPRRGGGAVKSDACLLQHQTVQAHGVAAEALVDAHDSELPLPSSAATLLQSGHRVYPPLVTDDVDYVVDGDGEPPGSTPAARHAAAVPASPPSPAPPPVPVPPPAPSKFPTTVSAGDPSGALRLELWLGANTCELHSGPHGPLPYFLASLSDELCRSAGLTHDRVILLDVRGGFNAVPPQAATLGCAGSGAIVDLELPAGPDVRSALAGWRAQLASPSSALLAGQLGHVLAGAKLVEPT